MITDRGYLKIVYPIKVIHELFMADTMAPDEFMKKLPNNIITRYKKFAITHPGMHSSRGCVCLQCVFLIVFMGR